jgi:trafficking protein particle complex subunit 4
MSLIQLFIINRSGGLIYNRNLSQDAPYLTINDWLRLGSTFHGLHEISSQVAPVSSSGIDRIETDIFVLECFQTLTGTKFVITARKGAKDLKILLNTIYTLYTDFVLKNPFYEVDMPIRCDLFNKNLDAKLKEFR